MFHSAFLISDNFDTKSVTRENIRFAFVANLPFRLRLGGYYRHRFHFRNQIFEIILQNILQIPQETPLHEFLRKVKNYNLLWTKALIVIENPAIDTKTLDSLRSWNPKEQDKPTIKVSGIFEAMEALNHFLVAYSLATNELFGGRPIRLFRSHDFMEYLRWEIALLCSPGEKLTDENFREMINLKPEKEFTTTGQITGELYDFPVEDLTHGINNALLQQDSFIHFEIAFEAKSKMVSGDYIGALLMAVAALEGAHAAFVQHELGSRLPNNHDKNLPDEFLKELGMTLSNQLTPYLLMHETERPSPELIQRCRLGIKIRNEIMHALKNKSGQYRLRTRTNREISEAYSAVLKVYNCYVSALENRISVSNEHSNQ